MKKYELKTGTYYIEKCLFDGTYIIYRQEEVSEQFGIIGRRRGGSYKTYEEAEKDLLSIYK